MILDSIRRNGTAILVYCVVIVGLFWGNNFLWGEANTILYNPEKSLSAFVINLFHTQWSSMIAAAAALLIAALLLYRLNERHLFITKREQLLPVVFLLLASVFMEFRYISGIHFALIAIVVSLSYAFETYRDDYAYRQVFMSAFCVSVASLFYPRTIFMAIPVVVALIRLKPAQWRDYIIFIAGLCSPYIFAIFYYFFTTGIWSYPFIVLFSDLYVYWPVQIPPFSPAAWVYMVYTILLVFVAMVKIMFNSSKGHKVKTMGINVVFMWMYAVCLACFFLYPHYQTNGYALLMALPATVGVVSYFSITKSDTVTNFYFITLILVVIGVQLPAAFFIAIADAAVSAWDFVIALF